MTTRDIILAYLRAIEAMDLDAVDAFLHPDVSLVEHPNKVSPHGLRADRAAMRAAGERGRAVMASQRYEVRAIIVENERAAVQIAWSGALRDGRELHAHVCSIVELRDGKVWRQEQYDCFA
jgi:ketosteroid isomerase-like protein